jgi:hypothetical protein
MIKHVSPGVSVKGPNNLLAQTVCELNNWEKHQVMVMILLMICTALEIGVHIHAQSLSAVLV